MKIRSHVFPSLLFALAASAQVAIAASPRQDAQQRPVPCATTFANGAAYSNCIPYRAGQVIAIDGTYFVSRREGNLGNSPATSPSMWAPLSRSTINIKEFGATGDGKADDTQAIKAAFAFEFATGKCLYFPSGAYRTTSELSWVDSGSRPLCIRGESAQNSYILSLGTDNIDAALRIGNPADNTFSSVDIRDFSFAANAHAHYAFHAIRIGPPASLDNVYFMGGSVSSFEGDFWNGQNDLRNLVVSQGTFRPAGASACVNGITFDKGPNIGLTYPSNQFTLTMPTVGSCTGIGLNLQQVTAITVHNAQLSGNHQNLYENCNTTGCNATGNNFSDMLLEAETATSEIRGQRNIIDGLNGNLAVYGSSNRIDMMQGKLTIEPGADNNIVMDSFLFATSTSAGKGTLGANNFIAESNGIWGAPFNTWLSNFVQGVNHAGGDIFTISPFSNDRDQGVQQFASGLGKAYYCWNVGYGIQDCLWASGNSNQVNIGQGGFGNTWAPWVTFDPSGLHAPATSTVNSQLICTADGTNCPTLRASFTTTASIADTVTLPGMTASGHCSQPGPKNVSAAANSSTTFVSAKSSNQITITHANVAGMAYDILCTRN